MLLARVHDDLPEDLVVGLAVEGGPASGDQHAAFEFLHVYYLLDWSEANR
jgi:hypothetical protein